MSRYGLVELEEGRRGTLVPAGFSICEVVSRAYEAHGGFLGYVPR